MPHLNAPLPFIPRQGGPAADLGGFDVLNTQTEDDREEPCRASAERPQVAGRGDAHRQGARRPRQFAPMLEMKIAPDG